jgi:dienelactone hydrolase
MARSGADLDGVVSFHGSLGGLPPVSDKVTAKVLVANGADAPFVGKDSIDIFKEDMEMAGVDFEFINYPGAKHSFTSPEANRGDCLAISPKYYIFILVLDNNERALVSKFPLNDCLY